MIHGRCFLRFALFSVYFAAAAEAQTTYFVNGACGDNAWTGTNSACQAPHGPKRTIQVGINSAVSGDTVIVSDGIYTGAENRDLDFGGRDIILRSASQNPQLCTIDCQGGPGAPHRALRVHSGETTAATIDGFTIRNGYLETQLEVGAGIRIESSGLTIARCAFIYNRFIPRDSNNRVGAGGGVGASESQLVILDTTFTQNWGNNSTGSPNVAGGAIHAVDTQVTLRDCAFVDNVARAAGAMFLRGGGGTVDRCTFTGNTSTANYGALAIAGNTSGAWIVTDCQIIGNSGGNPNGLFFRNATLERCVIAENVGPGRGVNCGEDTILRNCEIRDNHYGLETAGVFTPTRIENCVISGNTCTDASGPNSAAGGLQLWGGIAVGCVITANFSPRSGGVIVNGGALVNCVVTDNFGGEAGGGILAAEAVLSHCVVTGNSAPQGGGVMLRYQGTTVSNSTIFANNASAAGGGIAARGWEGSPPTSGGVANCVVWGNTAPLGAQLAALQYLDFGVPRYAQFSVSHTDSAGGQVAAHADPNCAVNWLDGNIDSDPLFADPSRGDLRLRPGSPCIDAGDNDSLAPDMLDLDGDGDSVELMPFDFDGRLRIWDGDDSALAEVDMGAFEFGAPIPGDLNGDCAVGLQDLAILLARFGTATGASYADGDLDADGDVDIQDLANLLANFGNTCS